MNEHSIRNNLLDEIFLILGEFEGMEDACVKLGKMSTLDLTIYLKALKKEERKSKKK